MSNFLPLRMGLFLYECLRLQFLLLSFAVSRPEGNLPFPWLACISCGALFPLMALFMWLDFSRHSSYLPLYTAGKGISFVSALVWLIVSRHIVEILYGGGGLFKLLLVFAFLLAGDLLSVVAGLFVMFNLPQRGRIAAANGGE